MILPCPLKSYVIGLHNLILMINMKDQSFSSYKTTEVKNNQKQPFADVFQNR